MLLPMCIAVAEAHYTCRHLHHKAHEPPPPPKRPRAKSDDSLSPTISRASFLRISTRLPFANWGSAYRGAFQASEDLDIDEPARRLVLDDDTKTACLLSFRLCLLANTFMTVGVATTYFRSEIAEDGGHLTTVTSWVCVPVAAVVCLTARLGLMSRRSGHSLRRGLRRQDSGENVKALLGVSKESDGYHPLCACHGLRARLGSAGWAGFSGGFGAAMPLVPWALEIWRNHQEIASIAASVATAALAMALISTVELRRNIGGIYVMEEERLKQVSQRAGQAILVSVLAAVLGGMTWVIDVA
jgi:hypothetical protein